jgi:hypothetical protein
MGQLAQPSAPGTGRLLNYQILTAGTTFVPQADTAAMDVLVIGGSAGSPYLFDAVNLLWHAGLAAGASARKRYTTIAESYAYSIGGGGSGGAGGSPAGTAGGTTTFGGTLIAPGGDIIPSAVLVGGGGSDAYQPGGTNSAAVIGSGGDANQNYYGENGQPFFLVASGPVFGGGQGGSTPMGVGAQYPGSANTEALPGSGYGSGAGGAISVPAQSLNGVNGRPGCIVIWEWS